MTSCWHWSAAGECRCPHRHVQPLGGFTRCMALWVLGLSLYDAHFPRALRELWNWLVKSWSWVKLAGLLPMHLVHSVQGQPQKRW